MNFSDILCFLLNLLFIGALGYYGYIKLNNSPIKGFYFPAMAWKATCGIAMGVLYYYYYQSGDTVLFFEKALKLNELPLGDQLRSIFFAKIPHEQRSTLPIIKITSLILIFSGSNYWIASVYFSMFSFTGTFFFVNQLVKKYRSTQVAAPVSFLFFPSVVFWSSGILKESIVFGIIMFLLGFFLKYRFSRRLNFYHIVFSIVGAWLMIVLKYYIAAVFLPILVIVFVIYLLQENKLFKSTNSVYQHITISVIIFGGLFWATSIQYNLDLTRVHSVIQLNQQDILNNSTSESSISYLDETKSSFLILVNLPIAFLSGLFRPIFPEVTSFPLVFIAIENTLLLILLLLGAKRKVPVNKEDKPLYFGLGIYIVLLATLLAYSTPNFGTLSRYKVYHMPFFLLLVLMEHPFLKGCKADVVKCVSNFRV